MPINKSKLVIFEPNKNLNSLINQNLSKSNEKRKNKVSFADTKMEEYQIAKLINSTRNLKFNEGNEKKNILLNSIEKEKMIHNPLIKSNENMNHPISLTNFLTESNNNIMRKYSEFDSINKSPKDTFPYINTNEKEKHPNKMHIKLNLNINNKEKNIIKTDNNKNTIKKKLEFNNVEDNQNSLSIKEKACLVLSKSNILNLKEKIIFSRSSPKLKMLSSSKDIINYKIKELEQKIQNYENKIDSPFSPSKIASMSLNLIMKEDEEEFKNFLPKIQKQNEKLYYFIYIQLIFLLLGEDFNEEEINEVDLENKLFNKLKSTNINIKDYLYKLLVAKKIKKQILSEKQIHIFNELFEELPDLIKYVGKFKNSKFISFSYFIIKELYIHFQDIRKFIDIKNDIKEFIACLKKKISNVNKEF